MNRIFTLLIILLGYQELVVSQTYQMPLPSKSISGTFGELRESVFHMGLDIRTYDREGWKVTAAADGYIYRILVGHAGYGKALYIRHDDGSATLYGHLSHFTPKIDSVVYRRQFEKKRFTVDIYPKVNQFRVKQGEVIAFSGNTGFSHGPHLHYEVRRAPDQFVNPLIYHKNDIEDKIAPIITHLAIEPLSPTTKINGDAERVPIQFNRSENTYSVPTVIAVEGKFGLEYGVYDLMTGSYNRNGVYRTAVFFDDKLTFEAKMDSFEGWHLHYLKLFMNYPVKRNQDIRMIRCYRERNNQLPVYTHLENEGVLEITDDEIHTIRLESSDFHGNTAKLFLKVRKKQDHEVVSSGYARNLETYIRHNWLYIRTPRPDPTKIINATITLTNGQTEELQPTAILNHKCVFVYPLEPNRIPKKISVQTNRLEEQEFQFVRVLYPGKADKFSYNLGLSLEFPKNAIFDTTYLEIQEKKSKLKEACSSEYTIGDEDI
ncbi:MAG: M23 family metallopeptidase, partial [Bacteroidia bacterium]|nr:M23 family metallopeptidase [Bacteroidia bacterium]